MLRQYSHWMTQSIQGKCKNPESQYELNLVSNFELSSSFVFDIDVNLYLKQVERAIQTILQTDSTRKGVTLEYSCV